MPSQNPPRALQRKASAVNLKLGSADGATSNVEDTTMLDFFKVPKTPVSKHRRPLLREPLTPTIPRSFDSPLPQTPDTEWVRRGSGLVWNPPSNPFYAHLQRVAFEPTWYHQGEDVHGFPPYDPTTGGHGRYDYGGRQYRAPQSNVPPSPYRFKDASEYPKPAKRRNKTSSREGRIYKPYVDGKEKFSPSAQSMANVSEIQDAKHADPLPSSVANTVLDAESTLFRTLKRALPQVAEDQALTTSQAEIHRPPERTMTLTLRPAGFIDSFRCRESSGSPAPVPASKRRRTNRSPQQLSDHVNSRPQEEPTMSTNLETLEFLGESPTTANLTQD